MWPSFHICQSTCPTTDSCCAVVVVIIIIILLVVFILRWETGSFVFVPTMLGRQEYGPDGKQYTRMDEWMGGRVGA